VSDIRDVLINLCAAAVGGALAFLWRLAVVRIRFRSSRRVWRSVLRSPWRIVVSEYFVDPTAQRRGPRELVDLTDLQALAQLLACFSEARLPVPARVSTSSQLAASDMRENLVVIGGPKANRAALKLDEAGVSRLRFERIDGGYAVRDTLEGRLYRPSESQTRVSGQQVRTIVDYGVIVSAMNPFNPQRRVLYMAGAGSTGTFAAVQMCAAQADDLARAFGGNPRETFECLVRYRMTAGPPGIVDVVLARATPTEAASAGGLPVASPASEEGPSG
jgi:hypothetical protein